MVPCSVTLADLKTRRVGLSASAELLINLSVVGKADIIAEICRQSRCQMVCLSDAERIGL